MELIFSGPANRSRVAAFAAAGLVVAVAVPAMLALAKGLTLTEGITLSVAGAAAGMTSGWAARHSRWGRRNGVIVGVLGLAVLSLVAVALQIFALP